MKKRPIPFYPPLIVAFPVLSVYSANLAYVPTGQLWRPLFVTILFALALWALLGLILRSAARGAAAATVITLCLFGYEILTNRVNLVFVPPMVLWSALTAGLAALAAWKLTHIKGLNILSVALLAVSLVNIGFHLYRAASLSALVAGGDTRGGKTSERPDVFYIILDGHGRSDAIKRAIGFDNSAFIDALKQRGFYVADQAHSNYCQTELSLSSSLNMGFIQELLPHVKKDDMLRDPLGRLIDDNEVARRFRREGYRFVAVTSGFPPVQLASADMHLGMESGRSMIELTLLSMTPMRNNSWQAESQFIIRRKELLSAFEDLSQLGTPTPAPRFIVTHILAPHPPFVFGPNGEALRPKGQFGYMDGSDFMTSTGTKADYRKGYSGQVEFIEKQTIAAIDRILSASPSKRPIIIIQGDHGSKVGLDQDSFARTDIHEVFPILNAYLVPDSIRKDLRADITPVNSFRLVLSDLFGEKLPPLPDRSWYSTFPYPYDFTEVTGKIEPVVGKAN